MTELQEKLIGILVGIARATDGNEHFITPELNALMFRALAACRPGASMQEQQLQGLIRTAVDAKREMVPNCFLCDNPCGRTSDYCMGDLQSEPQEVQEAKYQMLELALDVAAAECSDAASLLYDAMYLLGMDMNTPEYLVRTSTELKKHLTVSQADSH